LITDLHILCLQCRPEYKVPGLYIVDSIVRQSRHQFGPDKDVYGPRFMRNIAVLFHSLLCCPPDDIVSAMAVCHKSMCHFSQMYIKFTCGENLTQQNGKEGHRQNTVFF